MGAFAVLAEGGGGTTCRLLWSEEPRAGGNGVAERPAGGLTAGGGGVIELPTGG